MGKVSVEVEIAIVKICDLVEKKKNDRGNKYDQKLWEACMELQEAWEDE